MSDLASPSRLDKPHKRAYVVVVTGKLSAEHVPKFVELFRPMARYVAENESGCLCYELSTCDDEPGKIVIFERYISQEYFEQVHLQSDAFKKFFSQLGAANLDWAEGQGLALTKYVEKDVGFM